jgi:HlyD family secretion protein
MKKIIPLLILIIIIAGVYFFTQKKLTKSGDPNNLTLYGNIDTRHVELAFNSSERIKEILFYEGQKIKKGDLLARLDTKTIELQIKQINSEINAQKEIVTKLEKGSRDEEIKIARAELETARAVKINSETTLNRIKGLAKTNLVSKQQLDDAISNNNVSVAKFNAAQEYLNLALAGPREEDKKAANATLDAMYARLDILRKNFEDAILYAPSDGIIEDRILEPGDMAFPNKPVFTIAIIDPVWAKIYVPETMIGKIKQEMEAQIITDSYPDKKYNGKISYISPTSEFTPKNVETPELRTKLVYEVRIMAQNPLNELRLGMPVTVSINLNSNTDANSTSTKNN